MSNILHLFRKSQFVETYIKGINSIQSEHKHFFWVYGNFDLPQSDFWTLENVRYSLSMEFELSKPSVSQYFEKWDLIIYHGIFDQEIINFFYENQLLLRKLVLCFWGGDIPNTGCEEEKSKKRTFIENALAVINLIDSDYQKLCREYDINNRHFLGTYFMSSQKVRYIESQYGKNREYNNIITIQIGNSGDPTNKHIELIDIVKRLKSENVKFLIPISYGDKSYIEKVEEYARDNLGESAEVLTAYMSFEEYVDKLSEVDVALFAMKRQQALGNINILFMLGAKIYLDKNGQLFDYFNNELGVKVFDIQSIAKLSLSEIVRLDEKTRNTNKYIVNKDKKDKAHIGRWDRIICSLLCEGE